MTALLTATDLSLPPRLQQVSLSLHKGQTLGLLGVNGAGKSTLLALLAGAQSCSQGKLLIDGQPLHHAEQRQRIGWLAQNPPSYPDLSVLENLRFFARLRRVKASPEILRQSLAQFDLEPLRDRLARQLSGGESRRLGLACCLVHQPDILLLDEPTAGLDPLQAEQLRELIRARRSDSAVLIASHLLPDIQGLCDSALLLHQGRIAAHQQLHQTDLFWQAAFTRAPERQRLLEIPGIAEITQRVDAPSLTQLTLQLEEPATAQEVEQLVEHLAGQGWGLRLWRPAEADLLQRFRELSSGGQS